MHRHLVALLLVTLISPAAPASAQVNVWGEPGSFGSLGGTLPSGHAVSTVPDPDFDVTPGRSAFFMATTSDGTVFSAGFHQTTNNLLVTSCYMNVICLNPSAATCWDAASGQNQHFSNILVLTRNGFPTIPNDESLCLQPSTRDTIGAKGPDIADIQTVWTEGGEELVAFSSGMTSLGGSDLNGFPTLGFLRKENGGWRLDPTRQFWRDDLASSSAAGQAACPNASCGGIGEIAFLDASHNLVWGSYFPGSQRVVVVDLNGVVQAQHQVPNPGNRCTADPNDVLGWLGIRQVETDPTGTLGDERIVATVDGGLPFNHPIQEFRYDDLTKTLEPVTNMVGTSSGTEPLPDCVSQGQNANYDVDGNLVVNSTRDGKQVFHVYFKDPQTGRRSIEDNCPFTGYTEANLGAACLADLSTGFLTGWNSDGSPRWTYPSNLVSSQFDPGNRVLSRVDVGWVDLIDTFRANDRTVYASYAPIQMNTAALPLQGIMIGKAVWKGVLVPATQSLWAPVASITGTVVPGCQNGIFCDRPANHDLPSWLYEVKYEQVLDGGLRVLDAEINRPFIDTSSNLYVRFEILTNQNSTVDASESGFWIFPKDGGAPVLDDGVTRGTCSGGHCWYKAGFRQSNLAGEPPGEYRWSLVLTTDATGETVHVQGVVDVQ